MRLRNNDYVMDMTAGPLLPQILLFSLPLMFSSILQLLFNAADVIVVSKFDGSSALAAVGSTGALINLIVNLFLGLSVGANVLIARYYGAGAYKDTAEAIHTSIAISIVGGVVLAIIGFIFSRTFLIMMDSPKTVLPLATLYMKIYFLGMPFNMLYNFGSAVLRAVGDTRRPLLYLAIAGIVNVLLNLLFVIVFHMSVAGVALATIISQAISAILVLLCLIRSDGVIHVDFRKLRIDPKQTAELARIGLPAGLQGMLFSLSNVLIQSTVNSFGEITVAGNTVAGNIEGFVYVAMNALHQASVTFTSQNVGARMHRRLRKVCTTCVLCVSIIGFFLSVLALLFRVHLLGIYSDDPAVIAAAERRMWLLAPLHFTCGIMDVLCGVMRGLGSTVLPMIVSLVGACGFRIFWIYCILPFDPSLTMLYISYPISWILTSLIHGVCCVFKLRSFPISAGSDAIANVENPQ